MEDIREELLARGVTSVQGWILTSAVDVSADGRVIVGFGRNLSRQFEAWLAVLPLRRHGGSRFTKPSLARSLSAATR